MPGNAETTPPTGTAPAASILIVDSDVARRSGRRTFLARLGYRVSEAGTSEELRARIRNEALPAAVVLVESAGLDALGLCRFLHANTPDIPLLLACQPGSEAAGLSSGADVCLAEAVEPELLAAQLGSILRRLQQRQSHGGLPIDDAIEQRRLALEIARLGVWEFDPASALIRFDARCAEIVGLQGREVVELAAFLALVHPDDRATLEEEIEAALRPGGSGLYAVECRVIREDGTTRWVAARGRAVRWSDESGPRPLRFLGTLFDMSERREAEGLLRESEDRFRLATEATGLGAFDFYPQTGRLVWSPHAKEHFGLSADKEVDYQTFLRGLHPDDRDRVHDMVQGVQRPESGGRYATEYRTIGIEDGKERWLSAWGRVFFDSSRQAVRFIGMTLDITARKQSEMALHRALREAEEGHRTLQTLLDHVPLGITIADAPDVSIRAVSRFGREVTGRPAEEIEGIPAALHPERWGVFHSDGVTPATSDELPLTRATVHGEEVRGEEWVLVRPDGTKVPILCTAAPIRDSQGQVCGGVIGWQDITERKAMEDRLRSIAQFPDENPSPVLRFASDGRLLYANAAASRLVADIAWGGTPPAVLRQAMGQALSTGKERELEVATPNGRILSFFCVPVVERRYVNLYGRDVTEARQAEQALQESERRFRGTFENAAVGIAHIDGEGRFLRLNQRFRQMLGLDLRQLQGRRFSDLTHPEDRSQDAGRFMAMMRGETESQVLEKRYLRPDGSFFWVQVTRSLQRDGEGRPAYAISIVQDISDRRRAEATLRESELFYRQTLESIPGMVFTTRPDGYRDYQSQQWVDYTGVPVSEMLGDGWNRLLHPHDRPRALAAWRAAIAGTAPYDLEYRVRRNDGQYEWFKVIGRPIQNQAGEVVKWFGVALNIEDLRRTQDALTAARVSAERAKATAEEASAAKDHFLAVLSHELRTPLTPVVTGIALLKDDAAISERSHRVLEVLRRNVELESRLIDDLLDLTRVARGVVELDKHHVELSSIIDRAVEVCRPDIEARGLHFGVDYGPHRYVVEADAARLQQVFWNLLKNAIKFTPAGGCVGFRCRSDNGCAVVEVSDSGIGIERRDLERIFDAFAQAERSARRQFGGLGLGLAISKALVEMHGGNIEADSEGLNKGATFRVRLPVVKGVFPGPEESAVIDAVNVNQPASRLRLLVVEDHGDTADMLAAVLELEGHDVVKAADVATALEVLGRERFDLLLSDLGLPDRSGLDLVRELRSRGTRLPAIALSGYGQEQDIEQSRAAGFAEHLVKPVDPDHLIDAIRRFAGPGGSSD